MTERGVWPTVRRRALFWLPVAVLAVLVLLAAFPGLFSSVDPRACDLSASARPPSSGHPFGQDLQGCDVYANVVYGARASLSIGLLSTLIALGIAVVVGTLAGYAGGWVDSVLGRLTDVFLAFPFLLGAIVVLNSLGRQSVLAVALVLAVFSWPVLARMVRTMVRASRDAEYVQAARAMGFPIRRILAHHVLPNAIGPVLALATLTVGGVIVAESTLTFLGLGLRTPSVSWGLQLATAQSRFQQAPHTLVYPGVFLAITVLSLITLGDVLRDAVNPKERS
ncbi:ABC transporter permease [Kribbella sandramycini]|uniref:ABC transporter permease n=1 Tax=Kribbella sandramycini TaxID=60450 RepID=A0A7Y4L5Y9_9ACTN|nr:ABC transporter permease [Kribbella sandramycini]MBB6570776.1 ABC-type dipeptide/oligopeptide/nickel transport system permease subunit [Kribbella sandramycini]NOL43916.1 ABC transporter permease [Kribbella sandramycini]